MLKDEPMRNKTSLNEQRALAGSQDKKESLCPLKEEIGHSGGLEAYREIMQEERTAKAQPELRLATVIKDDKKYFHK